MQAVCISMPDLIHVMLIYVASHLDHDLSMHVAQHPTTCHSLVASRNADEKTGFLCTRARAQEAGKMEQMVRSARAGCVLLLFSLKSSMLMFLGDAEYHDDGTKHSNDE